MYPTNTFRKALSFRTPQWYEDKQIQSVQNANSTPVSRPQQTNQPAPISIPKPPMSIPSPTRALQEQQVSAPLTPNTPDTNKVALQGANTVANTLMKSAQNKFARGLQTAEAVRGVNSDTSEYDVSINQQKGLIDPRKQSFDAFKTNRLADVDAEAKAAETLKEQADIRMGETQRGNAQMRRDMRSENEKLYASLGTVDSYGVGSFTGKNENIDNELLRENNKVMQERDFNYREIDTRLEKYRRETHGQIADQEAMLNEAIAQIQNNIAMTEAQKQKAIKIANVQFIQTKGQLLDELSQAEGVVAEKKANAQTEYALNNAKKLLADMPVNISDEFKSTGRPTTNADYIFVRNNPEAAKTIAALMKVGGQGSMTEKQAQFANSAASADRALEMLSTGQVYSGFGAKMTGKLGEKLGTNSNIQQDYRSTVAAARTQARNAMLGANMTPGEMESLMALIPEYDDAPNIAKQKLITFSREMKEYATKKVSDPTANTTTQLQDPLGLGF